MSHLFPEEVPEFKTFTTKAKA
jgi:hypothetical protein